MQKKKEQNNEENDVVIEEEAESENRLQKAGVVQKLKEELHKCKEERQEYLNGWQRMKADSINLKKEEERKRGEVADFVKGNLFEQLLPVLDSFELAFGNKEVWKKVDENWRKGVEYIHSQLYAILKENGLEAIEPKDMPFDPHVHTSVETVEVSEKDADGIVIEVLQKGYVIKDKIVRPARVKVGKYTAKNQES